MARTLVQIVQEARGRLGQPLPSNVIGNTDAGIVQCLGLLNEFLEDLVTRKMWSINVVETTWTATATESQGTLDTLFPFGFEGLVEDTFFDRSTMLPIRGSMDPQEWANRKARAFSGPLPAFRIRGGSLLMSPPPAAGHLLAVEYFSSYFVLNGTTRKKTWTADDDVCVLDDALPVAYLKWAWKCAKGLDYAEDFRRYEMLLEAKNLRDARPQQLVMDGPTDNWGPGILVAPGSWNVR